MTIQARPRPAAAAANLPPIPGLAAPKYRRRFNKAMATRIQMKLKAATFGITIGTGTKLEELLRLYDNTGDGELDQAELTRLIRKHFNIGAHELPDEMIGENRARGPRARARVPSRGRRRGRRPAAPFSSRLPRRARERARR